MNIGDAASAFQLAAIDESFIRTKIGRVSDEILDEIIEYLDKITGQK